MTKRMRSIVTAIAAMAALATGGAVFAQAQNSGATPASPGNQPAQEQKVPEQTGPENSAADPDNVQDTTSPDTAGAASEPAGTETGGSAEKAETPGQESPEVANDDGPGGHADEPGNPNADHQFQGAE